MTGWALEIQLRRERDAVELKIRANALNHAAIDRFNQLSDLLQRLRRKET